MPAICCSNCCAELIADVVPVLLPELAALRADRSWLTISDTCPTAEYITCTLLSAKVAASI